MIPTPDCLAPGGLIARVAAYELDELRARTDAGDPFVGQRLPGLLEKQGRGEEAERLRRFGLNLDGSIAWA